MAVIDQPSPLGRMYAYHSMKGIVIAMSDASAQKWRELTPEERVGFDDEREMEFINRVLADPLTEYVNVDENGMVEMPAEIVELAELMGMDDED